MEKKYVGIISAASDVKDEYKEIANKVSNWLVSEDYNLIFGAATTGLMGECYKEFKNNDKEVIGYSVEKYINELEKLTDIKTVICKTTFDMKKEIYENSDLIVMLPGGLGTFSEFFAFLEENRSRDKKTPIEIYDENGFYLQLLEMLQTLVINGFTSADILDGFKVSHDKEEFINHINNIKGKER